MEAARVCLEEGLVLTSREDHVQKLQAHRVGNVMWSRWITNPIEKQYIEKGGSVIIGQVCGAHRPNPVMPWVTSGMGPISEFDLTTLTKTLGNGYSPHMFEPSHGRELVMMTLSREHWELFLSLTKQALQVTGVGMASLITTIENLEGQMKKE